MHACINCGADRPSDETLCTSCGISQESGERESGAAPFQTSCVVCNRTRQTLLWWTTSSLHTCPSCGVYYCGRCRDGLRDQESKVRWWMPNPARPGKKCRECEGVVPVAALAPGCLLSPALLTAVAISSVLVLQALL
jgi:predicted RNA-binding Zn-ribbon protein involved in translation (DUF1610 family)